MYKLTAEDANVKLIWRFDASSDDQAMIEAIFQILDRAEEDPAGPWAKGAVTLTDANGNVIQSMDAK